MTAPVVRLFLANGCNALQSLEVELQLKIILFLGVLTAGIFLFLTCSVICYPEDATIHLNWSNDCGKRVPQVARKLH